jgi:hypothetical protein
MEILCKELNGLFRLYPHKFFTLKNVRNLRGFEFPKVASRDSDEVIKPMVSRELLCNNKLRWS